MRTTDNNNRRTKREMKRQEGKKILLKPQILPSESSSE